MGGLPGISQKAKPCNAGDYVGRFARSKKGRGKARHPGARTPAVLLMQSADPLVMGSNNASYFVRKEKTGLSRRKVILLCVIALGGVAILLHHFW